MTIKELFAKAENGVLTYEQFEALKGSAKFVDLSDGNYVSKSKYEADIQAKTSEIDTLNNTISTRDTDLASLRTQLEQAGTDAQKLTELTNNFGALQTKYNDDVKAYKAQLAKQAYEFAVRDFAGTKKFTSNAAKRDFINSMISKDLKMDNGKILGAEDFVVSYSTDNADAFVKEQEAPTQPTAPTPSFVAPTQGVNETNPDPTNGFASAFHFAGVRPRPQEQ